MPKFSPLLAARPDEFAPLAFPCLASPKIDGVRAIVKGGLVLSRSGKPIPNQHVQRLFGHLHGFDGELVVGHSVGPGLFPRTQSAVMSRQGEPDVYFYVFDWWNMGDQPYFKRYAPYIISSKLGQLPKRVFLVPQIYLHNLAELDDFEELCLEEGFEGIMLRNPDSPYKFGRSTTKEGILLKIKRFEDAEAEVLGMDELVKAGGCPASTLGALRVRDIKSGVSFSLGTGFSEVERQTLWQQGNALRGALVRYRYFPTGSQTRPRFPVFAGLRSRLDMGEIGGAA